MLNEPNGPVIVGLWLTMATMIVSALIYFTFGTSKGATKRRVFRWYIALGGVGVAAWFTLILGIAGFAFFLLIYPLAALLSWHTTRFCDECGATAMNQFVHARFCARCGADLDEQDRARAPTKNQSG